MLQLVYLLLKAFGFFTLLPAGIPNILNLLPNRVLPVEWDRVMSNVYTINIVTTILIFTIIAFYYVIVYKVSVQRKIYSAWWLGFFMVFIIVYIVSVFIMAGDMSTRDGTPVKVGELILPVGLCLAIDCTLLYLILSFLFNWWPAVIRGGVPPSCWFNKKN